MDDILLVEPAEAVSENVKEAIKLRTDPLSATRLVTTPAQIKEKINAKMSADGRYLYNDQFSEVTVCDANGNNLVNNEYYSFIARDKDKLFMAKNNADTDVLEFSIPDKFNLDSLLSYYMGVVYNTPTEVGGYNVREIYTIDTSRSSENANACAKGSLTANSDGAYEWKTTPICKPLS